MRHNEIAILNRSNGAIADADAATIVAALQIQVDRDFAPLWDIGATLTYVASDDMASWTGKWNILLLDRLEGPGPLGSHDLTPEGQPLGRIYVADDIAAGPLRRSRSRTSCWKCSATPMPICSSATSDPM